MSDSRSAYVREALPIEYEAVSRVQARAFANDPLMNWLGSVSQPIEVPPPGEHKFPKDLELLYFFHHSLTLSAHLVQGRVRVVVIPDQENSGSERIVSAALWIPPGKKVDSLSVILRSQQYRVLFGSLKRPGGWGFTGFKRAAITFQPLVDKLQTNACEAKSLSFHDCWHLQEVTTDPEEEGKGYCSMLMSESLKITGNAPICLEATTPRTREIYLRKGFQITGEPIFGKHEVTEAGLPTARKDGANGFPIYTMITFPS